MTSYSFPLKWRYRPGLISKAVDLKKQGMSLGELTSVMNAVGLEAMVEPKHPDAVLVSYLATEFLLLRTSFNPS